MLAVAGLLSLSSASAFAQNAVNTATVTAPTGITDPTPANNTATDSDTIVAPQLTLGKTANPSPFTVGVAANYTLTLTNTGTAATTAVSTITDTIPTGLTIGALPAGCVLNPAGSQTVVCTVATGLAVNATASFVIPVTPTAAAAASVTNSATVTGGGDAGCPAATRCTSTVTTPVNRASINIAKTAGTATGPVAGNYSVTYTVTATNNGTAAGTYGPLTDSPVFSSNLAVSGATWTTSGAGAPAGGSSTAGGPYQLALANTAIGAGVTHTFNLTITYSYTNNTAASTCSGTPTPGNGLYNGASLPAGQETGSAADNAACVNSPPPPQQLTITKTASAASFTVGVAASYTLSVQNSGGSATSAVATITDAIPTGLTIGTLPASCTATGQNVTCTIPTGLAANATTSFVIPVTPTSAVAASVTNTATVTGGGDAGCPVATRCLSTVTTPVNRSQLTIIKTASATSFTVGVAASYTLSVQNTGTAATTAVSTITDTLPTGLTIGTLPTGCTASGQTVTCTIATGFAAGATTTFVIPVTPTAAVGGSVTNTATVSGGGDPTCPAATRCTSTVTTPVNASQLTITKTASATSFTVGVAASYTLAVQNTGTAATTATSTIVDTIPTGLTIGTLPAGCTAAAQTVTCTIAAGLAVNATTSFVIPVTPQASTAGTTLINTASVSGGGDAGCPAASRCTSTTSTPVTGSASLTLDKTASVADTNGNTVTGDAGDTITYGFSVTNTGTVVLAPVTVTDPLLPALNCSIATLPPGATASCAATSNTYVITAADVAAGSRANTATATGNAPGPIPDPTASDTETVPAAATPTASLTLNKTATAADTNGNTVTGDAGDTITYAFSVTNTGTVTLAPVTVSDPLLPGLVCSIATLAPSATASCTATNNTYVITAADATAGNVVNTATASGDAPGTIADPTASDTETTPTAATPVASLTLNKTASVVDTNGNTVTGDAGDTITYAFSVTNTGTVALAPVTVTDPLLSGLTCSIATLAPAATASCVATGNTYVITAADVTAGSRANTAIATGDAPGTIVDPTASDTETTPTAATPVASLTLNKTALVADTNGNTVTGDAGDTITYGFSVTNTGTVALAPVTVTDPLLPGLVCSIPTLATSATASCTPTGNTYVITAADVTAGSRANTATASGDAPGSIADPTASDTETTPTAGTPAASLTLNKTATAADTNGNTVTGDAGDTITYAFSVTNTGTVTLAPVTVTDPLLPSLGCSIPSLAPAATASCAATGNTYVITAADVTAGSRANTATASGDAPGTIVDPTASDTETTPTAGAPVASLTLNKTATLADTNGNTVTGDAGDTITYAFSVTNTGTVPLAPVNVTDPLLPGLVCSIATLAPAATASCVATGNTYVVTAADATAGNVVNTATASGDAPGTIADPTASDTETTPTAATPVPAITLDKTAVSGNPYDSVGDVIGYQYLVTNTGNVTINALVVTDDRIATVTCPVTTLLPGASTTCTASYTVMQADLDVGSVVNNASATGTPTTGTLTPATDTETVSGTATPAIAVVKTATLTTDSPTVGVGNAGDVITYAVNVTNTGNVTLNNLTVTDSFEGAASTTLACTPTALAPNAIATCTSYTHTVTIAEANAGGTLDNAVTASAQASSSGQTVMVSASTTASVGLEADPTTLRITKTASPRDVNIGDLVRYTLQIENTGTVDVVDGSIVDTPAAGFTYVDNSLTVADANGAGRLVGTFPIRIDQIDIVAGGRATVTYLLRVGAGVRPGVHGNSAYVQDGGATVSNVATAEVQLVADPMLDESLLVGTVFDDRDGDGWQDTSGLSGMRVQGGFSPTAYVANSTTIDRGNGPAPQADASAPLLRGIDVGDIAGRQSDSDPVAAHTIVVSQTLNTLSFSDDFVLTSKQGVTVRMDAAGNTRIERIGDAAKGLTAADPTVQRRVSQVESGYRVDYVISNTGVDERGIPGVRIASVEGLLIETDQYGRYHLAGVQGGPWERGRNFILKVDPSTLPPGSTFTTDNPQVRRITPGIPVRFDFGVKLPPGLIEGGQQDIEMELGAVLFNAESAEIRSEYLPVIDKMAEQVRSHGGGEVVIAANGESQALAYDRAKAVQVALLKLLTQEQAAGLTISLRTDLADPASTLVSLGESPVLGTVLFDTDQAEIKSEFRPVIAKIADDIERLGGGVIGVIGHADKRGSDAYNVALGLRRAKAVYEVIAAQLSPAARSRLRVEISDDPKAPVGQNDGVRK